LAWILRAEQADLADLCAAKRKGHNEAVAIMSHSFLHMLTILLILILCLSALASLVPLRAPFSVSLSL
jgi:hypothetical protein